MARTFELTTPLGKDAKGEDVLRFRALRGTEELGRLSEFDLSTVSTNPNISFTSLLGKKVTVKVELGGGGSRFFNGHVTRFAQEGMIGRFFHYRLTVRPWLWFLTRTADSRIFQEKTVPQIIEDVFDDHPAVASFQSELTEKFATREYCVQYRETDFNFVSRLMEEEGIYYFFEHQENRHLMRLFDSNSTHKTLAKKTLHFLPPGQTARAGQEVIHSWDFAQSVLTGVVALDDFDFKNPKADLAVKAQLVQKHDQADAEVFDWPGEYIETENGEHLARARLQEIHTDFDRAEAECNIREIAVGRLFTLTNGPRADQEREYLITRASYELRDSSFESSSAEEPTSYRCQFSALQSRQQFRPERRTLEPRMTGPQTAIVVGTPDDEIVCDQFGRVKVLFHWDRIGKKKRKEKENADSSCFLRVVQPWAGSNFGVIFLPRRGQEVLVDFLEGDPDQPIIVGSVYNRDQMPPYDLPANKTQSGIKTRSAMKGTPTNFNEIRFEDKKDHEQLIIHAERTMSESVEGSQSVSVGGGQTISVGGSRSITTGKEKDGVKQGDVKELVHNNHNLHVMGDERVGIDGKSSVNVKSDSAGFCGGEFSLQGSKGILLTADKVTLQGTTSITLVAAGSSLVIDAAGVTILGSPTIKLNPNGAAPPTVSPAAQLTVPPDNP
jgi:type VI secretion system secreted protein VgrG